MNTVKFIEGYEGLYTINILGEVFSVKSNRFLKHNINVYYGVSLSKNRIAKNYKIHRLIALNFIPNPENKPHINHIDGNKFNNSIENLEWCTPLENNVHAYRMGLKILPKGRFDRRSEPITQFSLEGEFIRHWECARQCEREGGFKQSNIWHCLKGNQKKSQGYIWKYRN